MFVNNKVGGKKWTEIIVACLHGEAQPEYTTLKASTD
jgi:hypothetical protein